MTAPPWRDLVRFARRRRQQPKREPESLGPEWQELTGFYRVTDFISGRRLGRLRLVGGRDICMRHSVPRLALYLEARSGDRSSAAGVIRGMLRALHFDLRDLESRVKPLARQLRGVVDLETGTFVLPMHRGHRYDPVLAFELLERGSPGRVLTAIEYGHSLESFHIRPSETERSGQILVTPAWLRVRGVALSLVTDITPGLPPI